MKNRIEDVYIDSIKQLNLLMEDCKSEFEYWDSEKDVQIEKIASNMDGFDYCFSIGIGIVGAFVSTSEQLKAYLEGIHEVASGATGEYDFLQKFLGKILNHKGDNIDQIGGRFVNRSGDNAYGLFHRLLWGHDVLRFGKDNPFSLMFEQKGVKGILQALRHLLADTMSHQGLPFPGSSLFDYEQENGKLSNYLINIAQNLSEKAMGNKRGAEEIYSHIFTIRFQDVMGGTASKVLSELYCSVRHIDNMMRKIQIQLVTYSVNFFVEALVGATRQGGVPYISIPVAGMTIKKLGELYYYSIKETKFLKGKTSELIAQGDLLEREVNTTGLFIVKYDDSKKYIEELKQAEENVIDLLEFFEEE